MDEWKKNWFTETGVLNSDQVTVSIKADKILHRSRSDFQEVLCFESEFFGRTLVLDNAIQCTERDEFAYQEMIAHIPLNAHRGGPENGPGPDVGSKRVLIIGGGDGGVARECAKHPLVGHVDQVEIDGKVVEVSRQFLPWMAAGFDSPKVHLHIGDGLEFIKTRSGGQGSDGQGSDQGYDVIITDSSDPKGPAEVLFQRPFYAALAAGLRPGGVICCQAESYWFDLPLIKEIVRVNRELFPSVSYASTAVPSYPSGHIGFLLCSNAVGLNFRQPATVWSDEEVDRLGLKYYSADNHRAAFCLPVFVKKELGL